MRLYFAIIMAVASITSCVANSNTVNTSADDIKSEILSFEKELVLPNGAKPIKSYARFYKVIEFKNVNLPGGVSKFVSFAYFIRNFDPGIYIVNEQNDLPDSGIVDGGCLSIYGEFRLSDRKIMSIKCWQSR